MAEVVLWCILAGVVLWMVVLIWLDVRDERKARESYKEKWDHYQKTYHNAEAQSLRPQGGLEGLAGVPNFKPYGKSPLSQLNIDEKVEALVKRIERTR